MNKFNFRISSKNMLKDAMILDNNHVYIEIHTCVCTYTGLAYPSPKNWYHRYRNFSIIKNFVSKHYCGWNYPQIFLWYIILRYKTYFGFHFRGSHKPQNILTTEISKSTVPVPTGKFLAIVALITHFNINHPFPSLMRRQQQYLTLLCITCKPWA